MREKFIFGIFCIGEATRLNVCSFLAFQVHFQANSYLKFRVWDQVLDFLGFMNFDCKHLVGTVLFVLAFFEVFIGGFKYCLFEDGHQ